MADTCQRCIEKWGQEPHAYGDSVLELDAYDEHLREHVDPSTPSRRDTTLWHPLLCVADRCRLCKQDPGESGDTPDDTTDAAHTYAVRPDGWVRWNPAESRESVEPKDTTTTRDTCAGCGAQGAGAGWRYTDAAWCPRCAWLA